MRSRANGIGFGRRFEGYYSDTQGTYWKFLVLFYLNMDQTCFAAVFREDAGACSNVPFGTASPPNDAMSTTKHAGRRPLELQH